MRKLHQSFITRFAPVAFDSRLGVVWIYLKWNEAERVKGRRLDDWHIVSRSNRRTRDVRTGTPAHIWNSTQHTLANDFDDTGAVEAAQKVECVAAADNYRVRSFDGAAHITPVVNR